MTNYYVDLKPIPGHSIPTLLESFGAWLSSQESESMGRFYLKTESVTIEWDPDRIPNIQCDAFSFLSMYDGSLLLLVNTRVGSPPAVALLGSEGETDTVATSLEEFLVLLGDGETGVNDLDDEDATGRAKLKDWLTENKVQPPKASPFDFDNFLDGDSYAPPPAISPSNAPLGESLTMLPPFVRQIALMVGRRADDPDLVDFVTRTLDRRIPNSTTEISSPKYIIAKNHGLELAFGHNVNNVKYPLIPKSENSYVPYLTYAWLRPNLPDPLPFGLKFGMSVEEITSTLGDPAGQIGSGGARWLHWKRELDPTRDIWFWVQPKTFSIGIKQARELTHRWDLRPLVGLFVAWLAHRRFLEPTAFLEHAALLDAVTQRKERGSKLVQAALQRGLWDIHLKDLPGLRNFAYEWMHNFGGKFIRDDLINVFGSRAGAFGIKEAAVDDDDWPTVDKATPALDRRFAEWLPAAGT
jgi:hypothetical protein